MSDNKKPELPFDSGDAAEQALWEALGEISPHEPSPALRRSFYRELEQATATHWPERLRTWLGFSGNAGWLTASACVLFGLVVGQVLDSSAIVESERLVTLEQNVAMLKRNLILDRLESTNASKRLRGIVDALNVVEDDVEIANALLVRATEDRVHSVRAAAIDALGPQLATPVIGVELMNSLVKADSPLIQLALVDLVLRSGSKSQIEQLLRLVNEGILHPDLAQHVRNSIGSDTV